MMAGCLTLLTLQSFKKSQKERKEREREREREREI